MIKTLRKVNNYILALGLSFFVGISILSLLENKYLDYKILLRELRIYLTYPLLTMGIVYVGCFFIFCINDIISYIIELYLEYYEEKKLYLEHYEEKKEDEQE